MATALAADFLRILALETAALVLAYSFLIAILWLALRLEIFYLSAALIAARDALRAVVAEVMASLAAFSEAFLALMSLATT